MSYDISLIDPVTKKTVLFDEPHQMRGGMFAVGGTREAWLNITYNYSRWYYRPDTFGESGIRSIYGMTGAESIPVLERVIKSLESTDEDISEEEKKEYEEQNAGGYWKPTRENALRPLHQLLAMAKMRPDAIFGGD